MPRYQPLPAPAPAPAPAEATPAAEEPRPLASFGIAVRSEHPVAAGRPRPRPRPRLPAALRCPAALAACADAAAAALGPFQQPIVGYLSGALFALGWWIFIDGVAFNASHPNSTHSATIGVEDCLPGIFSTLALIIVNLIDRETLNADDFAYSGENIACKARACAFFGVTLALGALGGALAVLSLKFLIPGAVGAALYLGQTIAIQNFMIFLR